MSSQPELQPRADAAASSPIRVLVVDDSAVVRGLIVGILRADPNIEVVKTAANGAEAVEALSSVSVDVVVLDIEMPVMDGLTAIPKLLAVDRGIKIIMASTLTTRNAEISMRALSAGASDYVPKPTTGSTFVSAGDFKSELVEKIKEFGRQRRRAVRDPAGSGRATGALQPVPLRQPGHLRPSLIAIGSSTGGPTALGTLLAGLDPAVGLPVVVTQHMPPKFTSILAANIQRSTSWECVEGEPGGELAPGRVVIAPGGYHMLLAKERERMVVRLDEGPKENFCRPAVDPMLRSAVAAFNGRVLAVILTGMGHDGLEGGRAVVEAGGSLVAQDEESSTVWGMPGAVAKAGLCCSVLPLDGIADGVTRLAKGAH